MFRRRRKASDFSREIESHIQLEAERLREHGLSEEDARAAARRAFGNVTQAQERFYESHRWLWFDHLWQDLRFAFRTLRKSPGFTAVAVLTLALGIGANTAIFGLIDAVMISMLPVPEPQQLVEITRPGGGTISYPFFEAIRDRNDAFSGVLLLAAGGLEASAHFGGTDLGDVRVSRVSGNYFEVLRVSPVIGRVLAVEDRDTSNVGVISYGFWQRALGADPSVLGKTLQLGADHVCTIVGVAPPNFTGLSTGRPIDLWIPVPPSQNPVAFMFRLVARRKPGVSEDQALANVQLLARQLGREWKFEGPLGVELTTAGGGLTQLRRKFTRPLLVLMLISALLLMVALNIGNLLLARASAREQEVGVRLSLGASRSRLLRQLLTESFLLAGAGTAFGLLLAPSASGFLVRFLSLSLGAYQFPFSINGRMLSFTVYVCCAVVLLFGIAPALAIMRLDPATMFCGSRRGPNDPRSARRGKLLMTAQVGTSCVLLAGAVLFSRSLQSLARVDSGFNPQNVLLVHLGVSSAAPKDLDHVRLFDRVLQRFAKTRGVRSVAMSSESLFSGNEWTESVNVPGIPVQRGADRQCVFLVVSPGFFRTMATSMMRGRDFTAQDDQKAPKVAVVNEAMARFYFPGRDPIGRTFQVDSNSDFPEPLTVVGLVQNSKYKSLKEKSSRIIYLPALQTPGPFEGANFEVRTAGNPLRMVDLLWVVARSESPYLRDEGAGTQQQLVDSTIAQDRMLAELSGFIGALAAILVCLGLYGLTAYQVSRRTAEIGVRMALGALRRDVVCMILKSSMVLVLAGAAAGIAATLPLIRVIGSLLFGVHPLDVITLLATPVILVAIGAAATYLPARRATRVDPMVALRHE